MPNVETFLRRARGMSLVERWNFHYRISRENVAEHSFWVAFYAMVLLDMDDVSSVSHLRTAVLEKALVHDLEEAATGDCPFLVKREVKQPWKIVARKGHDHIVECAPFEIKDRMNSRVLFDEDAAIEQYVKAADLLDVIMYAEHERMLGNNAYEKIKLEAMTLMSKIKLPSVQVLLKDLGFDFHPVEHKQMTHL